MLRAPRRPKVARPCARCGTEFTPYDHRLLYCGKDCAHAAQSERYAAQRFVGPVECAEPGCARPRKGRTRICGSCTWKRYVAAHPEAVKARYRRKTHIRKAKTRFADFTPTQEREMRAKAKRCPLCSVRLINTPYLSASKELDHIVPLGVGGTHTLGNVRIICRACNVRRPHDGSDYSGPVTLFALEVA